MGDVVRVPLTFTGPASESDSGTYNCTAVNGGEFFLSQEGLTLELSPAAVNTTRELQVVVLGKTDGA